MREHLRAELVSAALLMAAQRQRFTRPAQDDDFVDPLKKVDPLGWLGGEIRGKAVLCLAAGGGKHGPLYAAAGAIVTVVDLSPAQLAKQA